MKLRALACCCIALLCQSLLAAPKQHIVLFGKWTSVKWFVGEVDDRAIDLKVRPLLIDGRVKEFTVGPAHEVTDRTFAVQRMYRLNDSLPDETGTVRWRWQRGGWLTVDRLTGKVQAVLLPSFDPYYSAVAWFRDYAAYCGISDDGKTVFTIVAQLGKRKPVLKKAIGDANDEFSPDSACSAPVWQRAPSRVTFSPKNNQKFTYTIRSRVLNLLSQDEDADDE